MKNVLVGQSGGPTAVINSSLAGVYETAKACGAVLRRRAADLFTEHRTCVCGAAR